MGYVPLYFSDQGYSPFEISLLSSAENIAGILGPALLVARRYPSGRGVTILSALSAALLFCITPNLSLPVLCVFWSLSLLANRAVFALINEGGLREDRRGVLSYSETRSWGSASFLIVMYLCGLAVQRFGTEYLMVAGGVFFFILALTSSEIRDGDGTEVHKTVSEFIREAWTPKFTALFLSLMLMWASHGPAYTYYSLHLTQLGWSASSLALSWNVAVLAEIIMFILCSRIERHLSLSMMLMLTQVAAVIRWTLLATVNEPSVVVLTQLLHGLTFGLCFVVSQKILGQAVAEEYRKSAFAAFFALTGGVGSLLGKIIAGYSTKVPGYSNDFTLAFFIGAVLATLSLVAWVVGLKNK
jgi:PPP family 3-phenylpropionic acid transporter